MENMFWAGLSPEEARRLLANKDKSKNPKKMALNEAVEKFVKNGDNIGVGGFVNGRQPVAIVHEIVRQGRKNLTLSFQSSGLAIEYFAGGMALDEENFSIKRMELAYWAHEAFGISPLFRYLTQEGKIEIEDWSNYNMSARFKAGAMGLPFIPTRSPLGSDIPRANRSKVMECPFTGQPVMLLPASHPNVAIIHVQEADVYGNCRIQGPLYTCPEIAMAAAYTIVTCERIIEHQDMVQHSNRVSIPFFSVDAVCEVPKGGYPGNVHGCYYFDEDHIKDFLARCEAFRQEEIKELIEYYKKYIFEVEDTDGFISQIPYKRLKHIEKIEPGRRLESVFPAQE